MAKRIDIDLLRAYDKEMRTRAMILQRNFEYSLDDVVRWGNVKLKCTTAGKTNTTSIELTDKVVGDTVTDGTCVWELVDPNAGGGGTVVGQAYYINQPVGHIVYAYEVLDGHVALDGSTKNKDDYLELVKWVTDRKLWTNDITEVGKFYDSGSTTFNLPNFLDRTIKGSSTSGGIQATDLAVGTDVENKSVELIPQIKYKADSLYNVITACLEKDELYTESTFRTDSKTITIDNLQSYDYLTVTYSFSANGSDIDYTNTELFKTNELGEHNLSVYIDSNEFANCSGKISGNDFIFTLVQVAKLTNYRIDCINGFKVGRGNKAYILDWEESTRYEQGTVVIHDNILYRCIIAHTSISTFETNKSVPIASGEGKVSEKVLSRKHLYDESTFNTASKTISLSAINTYKYLSVTYEVTDDTNTYSNTALIETSESGEHLLTIYVDNNNFAVLGAEISGDDLIITSYQVANLSKYRILSIDGIKEIYAGISDEGGARIEDWVASEQYEVGDFVVYRAVLYKCLIANSDATFIQSNWQAISKDGVTEWETNKRYAMYDLVMSGRNLYISLASHTSTSFADDLASGRWMQINGGSSGGESGGGSGKQVTKLGVVAPLSVDIDIPSTELFDNPSVEVLKFASGSKDVSTNAFTFNVGDGSKFSINDVVASESSLVTFDGVVRPNHKIRYKFGEAIKMADKYYSESATVDLSAFKSVEGVTVV